MGVEDGIDRSETHFVGAENLAHRDISGPIHGLDERREMEIDEEADEKAGFESAYRRNDASSPLVVPDGTLGDVAAEAAIADDAGPAASDAPEVEMASIPIYLLPSTNRDSR